MIKLSELLKETEENEYPPYMYSPVGFSCAVCEYHYQEEAIHKCSNKYYHQYIKEQFPELKDPTTLVDNQGEPIKDPSKWCSNWFHPKAEEQKES